MFLLLREIATVQNFSRFYFYNFQPLSVNKLAQFPNLNLLYRQNIQKRNRDEFEFKIGNRNLLCDSEIIRKIEGQFKI